MLSRLFNLGGEFDRSASPDDQFFATLRRPIMALLIGCFVVFILFSERRASWPDEELRFMREVWLAHQAKVLYPASVDPAEPPLMGMLAQGLASIQEATSSKPQSRARPWVVRTPAVIAAIGSVFATFWIGLMLLPRKAAFYGAVIAALNLGFFRHGRWPQQELLMTMLVCASVGCWIRSHREQRHAGFFAQSFYALAALAALAGGAAGFVIPMASALMLRAKPPKPLHRDHLLGAGLFLFILIGYVVIAQISQSPDVSQDMASAFLWKSHLPNFTPHTIQQFLFLAFLDWMPWLLLLPMALAHKLGATPEEALGQRLLSAWLQVAVFIALLTVGSRIYGLVAAWPAAALLIGMTIHQAALMREKKSILFIAVALVIAGAGLIVVSSPDESMRVLDGVFNTEMISSLFGSNSLKLVAAPLAAGGFLAALAATRNRTMAFFWNISFALLLAAAFAAVFLLPANAVF